MNRRSRAKANFAETLESRSYLSATAFQHFRSDPTGQYPASIAAADLTGSGVIDLVTANYGDGTVSVLSGDGKGNFSPAFNYPVGNGPDSVAVADVNGDGKPDIVVANSGTNPAQSSNTDLNSVDVLLNNGNGTFAAGQSFPAGLNPSGVAIADMNSDGIPDLLVTSITSGTVRVMLNNGAGVFTTLGDTLVGAQATSVATADLNGDGHQDVVTTDGEFGFVSVLLGNGDGTLQTRTTYLTGAYPRSVTIADVNLDGKLDLVVAAHRDSTTNVLIGNGKGKFSPNVTFNGGGGAFAVAVADVNGDGRPDMITADQQADDIAVLQRKPPHQGFSKRLDFAAGSGNQSLAIADFNGDGLLDIASASFNSSAVSVLLNNTKFAAQKQAKLTLTSNTSSAPLGSTIHFTATLGQAKSAIGEIIFFANNIEIGRGQLVNGVAHLDVANLPAGVQQITAYFGGDSVYAPKSASLRQLVISANPGADLVGKFISTTLPREFVAGETAFAKFEIINQGTATARGEVTNQLYLSTTGLVDADAIALKPIRKSFISLRPGGSIIEKRRFVLPTVVIGGIFGVVDAINSTGSVSEADLANNTAASPTFSAAVDGFGLLTGRPGISLTKKLPDGTVLHFTLNGPGTGVITTINDVLNLQLDNTTLASQLLITATDGNSAVPLSINVTSAIGGIVAPTLNQTGNITIAGTAHRVVFGSIQSSQISSPGLVGTFTAKYAVSDDSRVFIPLAKKIKVKGVVPKGSDPRFPDVSNI